MDIHLRRRTILRRAPVLLALLLFVQGLFSTWHEATTLHQVCADHGSCVDVDLDAGLLGAHASGALEAPRWRPDRPPSEDEHGHCALAWLARSGRPADRIDPIGHGCVEAPRRARLPQRVECAQIERVRLAPKHSPPA